MKWKELFRPVRSLTPLEAEARLAREGADACQLLDVRQPAEYERGHLTGARLIPLAELPGRLSELDPARPLIVYCAVGARSRAAAQFLAGKGFAEVYNLAGGIKAWQGRQLVGPFVESRKEEEGA